MSNKHFFTQTNISVSNARNKVAKIIRFLCANRGPQSIHTIRNKTRIDLQHNTNVQVKLSLQKNEKVLVSGTTFEYKPTISGINNRDGLRLYLESHPEGVKFNDLRDAYVNAETHLAQWQESGRIITFLNAETKSNVVFWYFGRLRKNKITLNTFNNKQKEEDKEDKNDMSLMNDAEEIDDKMCNKILFPLISDSIIATWNDIEIPILKKSLESKLQQNGLLNEKFSRKRTRTKTNLNIGNKRKKRRLNINRMNLTNVHMLQDEATKQKYAKNNNNRKDEGRELPQLPTQTDQ